MEVNVPEDPFKTTQQPEVDFTFGDAGGALVAANLIITDERAKKHKLVFDKAYADPQTQSVLLAKGTYQCTLQIHAYKDGALNAVYDSKLDISGTRAAYAEGSIPDGEDDDEGYCKFKLVIA